MLYSGEVNRANALQAGDAVSLRPSDGVRRRFWRSVWFIVLVALLLRLAVITIGHTYRITPRRDHFQFGWEMGRLARSIAQGRGFSSPTDLDSGPSAWTALYIHTSSPGFSRFSGSTLPTSAWMILAFNSVFAALTCSTIFRVSERIYGGKVGLWAGWTWAVFPYLIYWPVRVVWEASFSTFLLTLALWLAIRMATGTAEARNWVIFGVLWGLIALTNTALIILLPFFIGWMIGKLPSNSRRLTGGWDLPKRICALPGPVDGQELRNVRTVHFYSRQSAARIV